MQSEPKGAPDGKDGKQRNFCCANYCVPFLTLLLLKERFCMQNEQSTSRIAIIGIMVSDTTAVPSVNDVLHEFAPYILGRMGLPLRERGVNAISIILDAPNDVVNALTGKLGNIRNTTAKALFQKF